MDSRRRPHRGGPGARRASASGTSPGSSPSSSRTTSRRWTRETQREVCAGIARARRRRTSPTRIRDAAGRQAPGADRPGPARRGRRAVRAIIRRRPSGALRRSSSRTAGPTPATRASATRASACPTAASRWSARRCPAGSPRARELVAAEWEQARRRSRTLAVAVRLGSLGDADVGRACVCAQGAMPKSADKAGARRLPTATNCPPPWASSPRSVPSDGSRHGAARADPAGAASGQARRAGLRGRGGLDVRDPRARPAACPCRWPAAGGRSGPVPGRRRP